MIKRPFRVNKVDFRSYKPERDMITGAGWTETRDPPYHALTAIGVTLLQRQLENTLANADDIINPPRNFKDRSPPKSPFGPMKGCLGSRVMMMIMTKTGADKAILIVGACLAVAAMSKMRHSGKPVKQLLGHGHVDPNDDEFLGTGDSTTGGGTLTFEESAELQLKKDIEEALAAKKKKEEEDQRAARIAKAKEEAEAGLAAAPVAEEKGGSDSEEEEEKKDEDYEARQTQRQLFDLVQSNKHRGVDEMFVKGIDVNLRDQNGNSTLHIACQNGAKKMIKTCLKHKANLNAQNRQGQTPLHYCFAYQYDMFASFLIRKGANDLIVNEFGLTCYEGLKPVDITT